MVGPVYADRLGKLGIKTIGDLLYHLPSRYEDFSIISKIGLLQIGEHVTTIGTVTEMKNIFTRNGRRIQKARLTDETGTAEIIWYNQTYLANVIKPGSRISVAGEVTLVGNSPGFQSPDYEIIKEDNRTDTPKLIHTGRLVPVYPETEGVSSKWLRFRIDTILNKFDPDIREYLSKEILTEFNLPPERQAIYSVHLPKSLKEAENARRRLAFDELFVIQLNAYIRKKERENELVSHRFNISKHLDKLNEFISNLKFELTGAQKKVVEEILKDLGGEKPMNRLLEGDVGSGKTVVAAVAAYLTYLNGYRTLFMAPTEILANQHFRTISSLLNPYGVKVALITGKTKTENPQDFDLVIGTHALLHVKTEFPKLGLVVVDEQQRFGVKQRESLRLKDKSAHHLTLTATPIPRTIALTLYADLDLSVIDELPGGRMTIKTWVVPPAKRESAYTWIKKQITASDPHRQAFIVCPFIEPSESLNTVKAASSEYDRLKKSVFPDLKLALLHGRMSQKDKSETLSGFSNVKTDILVTTPVVEVGLDIPGATIMMIEAADRFGLAQLHQLRGRVGRNNIQSYCLLFTESTSQDTLERLKLLEKTFSGPKLAEFDLKLRGMGELYGNRQHGQIGLKIATFSDTLLIVESKKALSRLVTSDPALLKSPLLRAKLAHYTIKEISPD